LSGYGRRPGIEPLSDALALARKAERAAKQIPDKNALAVTVSKRSGVDRTVADSWDRLDRRLELFINLHRKDMVPQVKDGVLWR